MKVIFENRQSPGDVICMTAAIRDLRLQRPDISVMMDTTANEIWDNNPNVTTLSRSDPEVKWFFLDYPDIHNSGKSGRHFTAAFYLSIEEKLGITLNQTEIWPDIHLSDAEKKSPSILEKLTGYNGKFWLLNAGHKDDFILKHWGDDNYKKLVDILKNQVQFVQVGEASKAHHHAPIPGAINMIGKTTMRQLIHMAYKACGSVGPVSMHMHMSAAFRKPCVVIAGGREPWRWEAYPNQRYVCVNGCLPCCAADGCWKNWTSLNIPEHARSLENWRDKICQNMTGTNPKCMAMITPERVAEEVLSYYRGGVVS